MKVTQDSLLASGSMTWWRGAGTWPLVTRWRHQPARRMLRSPGTGIILSSISTWSPDTPFCWIRVNNPKSLWGKQLPEIRKQLWFTWTLLCTISFRIVNHPEIEVHGSKSLFILQKFRCNFPKPFTGWSKIVCHHWQLRKPEILLIIIRSYQFTFELIIITYSKPQFVQDESNGHCWGQMQLFYKIIFVWGNLV